MLKILTIDTRPSDGGIHFRKTERRVKKGLDLFLHIRYTVGQQFQKKFPKKDKASRDLRIPEALPLHQIYIPALNLGGQGAESRALFMFWHDVTINLTQFPPNFQGKMQHRPFMRSTQNSLEGLSASASPVLPTALLSAHSILPFNTPNAQEFLLLYF